VSERGPDDESAPADVSPQMMGELFPLIYPALRRRAEQCMRGEAVGHTLQATALVHEVYVRLASSQRTFQDEHHLMAVVTHVMRHILVDHARARVSKKRGGGAVKVSLDNACQLADQQSALFLDLQDAVDRLRDYDPLRARMFELDFLAGLTTAEIAEVLKVDPGKVKYGLSVARAWLRRTVSNEAPDTGHE
jgi:RNA polymerase sigma-70 factor (ECF subfamily)